MSTGHNRSPKVATKRCLLVFLAPAILLIVACTVLGARLYNSRQSTLESLQATAEVEAFLTKTYGTEVRSAIENFELQWNSLEAHTDPCIQSEVATGSYLEYFGRACMGESIYNAPFWLVTTSAVVTDVRVLEYGPERFKAVADVITLGDETEPGGEFKRSLGELETCNVYVFVRENDAWKLAGHVNVSDPDYQRDWWYVSDWLKEIIGELPGDDPCGWLGKGRAPGGQLPSLEP